MKIEWVKGYEMCLCDGEETNHDWQIKHFGVNAEMSKQDYGYYICEWDHDKRTKEVYYTNDPIQSIFGEPTQLKAVNLIYGELGKEKESTIKINAQCPTYIRSLNQIGKDYPNYKKILEFNELVHSSPFPSDMT